MALLDDCGQSYVRDRKTGKLVIFRNIGNGLTPEGREHLDYMHEVIRDMRICKELGIDYNPVRDSGTDRKKKD